MAKLDKNFNDRIRMRLEKLKNKTEKLKIIKLKMITMNDDGILVVLCMKYVQVMNQDPQQTLLYINRNSGVRIQFVPDLFEKVIRNEARDCIICHSCQCFCW